VIAIGAEADVAVGADDQEREVGDAQRGREIRGTRKQVGRRLGGGDGEHFVEQMGSSQSANRVGELPEGVGVCVGATNHQRGMAGAMGQFVKELALAVGMVNLKRVGEAVAGGEGVVLVAQDDRRMAVVDVEFCFGDRFVVLGRRIGKGGNELLVASAALGWVGDFLRLFKGITGGGDPRGNGAAFGFVALK
jgi:hypothetical protein